MRGQEVKNLGFNVLASGFKVSGLLICGSQFGLHRYYRILSALPAGLVSIVCGCPCGS